MTHRFILTHFPRALACLEFNHVHSKCLFRFSVFPLCGLCKLENRTVVANPREVFLLTHRWEIFPGALCVCWFLFQTISTSLIIFNQSFLHMDSSFYKIPRFFFLWFVRFQLHSLPETEIHTGHSTLMK